MRNMGRVLPIPVGKQLRTCELSSWSRSHAAMSGFICHIISNLSSWSSHPYLEVLQCWWESWVAWPELPIRSVYGFPLSKKIGLIHADSAEMSCLKNWDSFKRSWFQIGTSNTTSDTKLTAVWQWIRRQTWERQYQLSKKSRHHIAGERKGMNARPLRYFACASLWVLMKWPTRGDTLLT